MHFRKQITLLILASFSLFPLKSIADCKVTSEVTGFVLVNCDSVQENLEYLYSEDGKEISIAQQLGSNYFIDTEVYSLGLNDTLYTQSPALESIDVDGQYFGETRTEKVIIYKNEPYEPKERDTQMRVFWSAFNFSYQKLTSELGEDGELEYTLSANETQTLPKRLDFDLLYKNDVGFILSPSFEDKQPSMITFYKRLNNLDFGIFAAYLRSSVNQKTTTEDSFENVSITETIVSTGVFLRREVDYDNWSHLTTLRFGYYLEKSELSSDDIFKIEGARGHLETSLYYQVSDSFKIGSGLGVGFGFGSLTLEGDDYLLSDTGKVYEFAITPLKLQINF